MKKLELRLYDVTDPRKPLLCDDWEIFNDDGTYMTRDIIESVEQSALEAEEEGL